MLSRRGFAACFICAVGGFTATDAGAQAPGLKRKILSQIDKPAEGYVTIIADVEISAGFVIARHTHPGIESTYVLEGATELAIEGRATQTFKAGDSFQVPPNAPHGGKNGDTTTRLLVNYIVEKGKPLATPV